MVQKPEFVAPKLLLWFEIQRIVGRNQSAADRVIFLNSEGGLVQPAVELGLVERAYGLTTAIADNARCLSAYSMVFVGGRTTNGVSPSRVLFRGGKLGVHRPFLKGTGGVDPEVMRQVRAYFNYMDAGQKFYRLTAATPSSTTRLIKNAELKAMGDYRIMGLTKTNKTTKSNKIQKPRVQSKVFARKKSQRDP